MYGGRHPSGPNPIDCNGTRKANLLPLASHIQRLGRQGMAPAEDFGDRASRPGDPPKNFDPKKANFNDLLVSSNKCQESSKFSAS